MSKKPRPEEIVAILKSCDISLKKPLCGVDVVTFCSTQEVLERLLGYDSKRITTHLLEMLFQGFRRFCFSETQIGYEDLYVFTLSRDSVSTRSVLMFGQDILLPPDVTMPGMRRLEEDRLFHLRARSPLSIHCKTTDSWRTYVLLSKYYSVMNCLRLYSSPCVLFKNSSVLFDDQKVVRWLLEHHSRTLGSLKGQYRTYRSLQAPFSLLDDLASHIVREQNFLKEIRHAVSR